MTFTEDQKSLILLGLIEMKQGVIARFNQSSALGSQQSTHTRYARLYMDLREIDAAIAKVRRELTQPTV